MTELSFLIDLLLHHKISPKTKDVIAERIKQIDGRVGAVAHQPLIVSGVPQAASTLAAMARHGVVDHEPVAVIAQTPAAQAALNSRAEAMAGKLDKATGRPRKF